MALWDLPTVFPTWAWLAWHGFEVLIALIFGIRLLRSSQYKRVGFALLLVMLTSFVYGTYYFGVLGEHIVHLVDRVILVFILIFIGTMSLKKEETQTSDDLTL